MMPDMITAVTVIILIFIALLHFYWAFGGTRALAYAIPTKEGRALLNPGRSVTFFVGLVILGFALVAGMLRFYDLRTVAWGGYIVYAGWAIAGIFILRAVGEFHAVGFFKRIKGTPFAHYDTTFFSPLCLCLGVCFGVLSALA